MSLPGFSFPPESYSAVYVDGKSNANGVSGTPVLPRSANDSGTEPGSPHSRAGTSKALFGCFQCAIPKRIKGIRKNKSEAKNKLQ